MVALELFTICSVYTAGSVTKYFYEVNRLRRQQRLRDGTTLGVIMQPVEKFAEMSVEKAVYETPLFIGSHASGIGLLAPIGGGSHTEDHVVLTAAITKDPKDSDYNWQITDLGRRPCSVPKRFWLNTPDDLKNYFTANGIPQNIAPISLPMQVREIEVAAGTNVYGVKSARVLGTDLERVARAAAAARNIRMGPLAAALVVGCVSGAVVSVNWDDYQRGRKNPSFLEFLKSGGKSSW